MPLPSGEDLFYEHALKGATFAQLAPKRMVSAEYTRILVRGFVRDHVNRIEMELMVCRRTDQLLMLAVPDQAAESQTLALRYVDFVTRELERRCVQVEVHYRALPDGGVAFLLEDITDYTREGTTP